MKAVPVLLIGGPGRSGTNILKEVLRAHPAVFALPFEARFPIDPDGVAPALASLRHAWTPFTAERTLERLGALLRRMSRRSLLDRIAMRLGATRSYREWELGKVFPDFDELTRRLLDRLQLVAYDGTWSGAPGGGASHRRVVARPDHDGAATAAFREFLNELYAGALARNSRALYVDDNTFNILFAEELLELLPGARLVHMVRDPRDVIASYLRQRWSPKEPRAAAAYYRGVIERWRRVRSRLPAGRTLEIRLEDLCRSPRDVLEQVCGFASLTFDAAMLRVPLDKANSGRWKRELDAEAGSRLSAEFADVLSEYGYDAA